MKFDAGRDVKISGAHRHPLTVQRAPAPPENGELGQETAVRNNLGTVTELGRPGH